MPVENSRPVVRHFNISIPMTASLFPAREVGAFSETGKRGTILMYMP